MLSSAGDVARLAPVDPADDAAHGLVEPLVAHRLEDVVDDVELEGVDRVLLVRGDEDDRRLGR